MGLKPKVIMKEVGFVLILLVIGLSHPRGRQRRDNWPEIWSFQARPTGLHAVPIPSMSGLFTYIGLIFMVNVGKM